MRSSPTIERLGQGRIGVLGFGRDGQSAIRAFRSRLGDLDLTVLVESGEAATDLPLIHGPFDEHLQAFDVLIRSPGIPVRHPALLAARRSGVEIVNPASIWLAERGADMTVVGVTGSKGKSTTSALLAHLLRHAGSEVLLGGNIGVPLLDHLDTAAEVAVVELSSYQLADLQGRLSMGLITRLFPEHLDWHGSEADYVACKLRLADCLDGEPLLINATDERLVAATEHLAGRVLANRSPCIHRDQDLLRLGDRVLCRREAMPIIGRHNLDNAALALEAARRLGHSADGLIGGLADFHALPHRLQPIGEVDGVRWIDDSISTSPYATLAALEALAPAAVVLIVGGLDRRPDWQTVIERCRDQSLRALITLPDNGPAVGEDFRQVLPELDIRSADSMHEAVTAAAGLARRGDVVLLSPGAPSFPHYKDFEDRGRQFTAAVRARSGGA